MRLLVGLAAALALNAAEPADARIVTARDGAARAITFDVRAPGVRVAWYARLLRKALHGDEIETAVIRIVLRGAIARSCGRRSDSCYVARWREGLLIVPAGATAHVAHLVLHEYAHHIEASQRVRWADDPGGTARWRRARGIDGLLSRGRVADDYRLGWQRSVGEIFAEDYVQLHLRAPYLIGWLAPPRPAVRAALRRDVLDPVVSESPGRFGR